MTEVSEILLDRLNDVIRGEDAAVVVATMLDGLCSLLRNVGSADSDDEVRVLLAATLLSPGDLEIGGLVDRLPEALERLAVEMAGYVH